MKKDLFIIIIHIITITNAYPTNHFRLGVENISPQLIHKILSEQKSSYKAGLITNQSGVDSHHTPTIKHLQRCGLTVPFIFAPEHGMHGILAERDVPDTVDHNSNIPIISLYNNGSGKTIPDEYTKQLDLLVFDIQDSGMRHYTYISTLLQSMKIALEHNKPFIVLDRPNPLGGLVQGPLVDEGLFSFISIASIPLRHGMTIGEIAWYFNKYVLNEPIHLHVITMSNYNRSDGYNNPKLLAPLSPNLQSLASCYGYSFLGLLGEIKPFNVGVGTPYAFQCIGLPEQVTIKSTLWQDVQLLLAQYGIKSTPYEYTVDQKNERYKGLKLHFWQGPQIQSFELFIDLLLLCKKNNIPLTFSGSFDKAVGTKKVKDVVDGTLQKKDLLSIINRDLETFQQQRRSCLLY